MLKEEEKMKLVKISICSLFLLTISFYFSVITFALTQYKVQPGDTLWNISLKHHVELNELLQLNQQVRNPELIYPGQLIFLPFKQESINPEQKKMLGLLNAERKKLGLKPLVNNQTLSTIAEKKSQDMMLNKYVAHNSPTYGNPKDMLVTYKVPFKQVRENIGAGPNTTEEMFQTWINSQVNHNNILEKKATHVGIGYAKGGLHGHYWTVIIIESE
jgi:spore coat assembly protein SafA